MDSLSLKGIIIGSVCAVLAQAQGTKYYDYKAASYKPSYTTKYSTSGSSGYKAPEYKPYT